MNFKVLAPLAAVVIVSTFGAAFTVGTTANAGDELAVSPVPPQGARCSSLPWPTVTAKQIKAYKRQVKDYNDKKPGATRPPRCSRLFAKRTAKILPNKPPLIARLAPEGTVASSAGAWTIPASGQLTFKTSATDPDGDAILYTYSTTGGRVNGDGATVTWDLTGVAPGIYTISSEVDDGCGCIAFESALAEVTAPATSDY